MMFSISQEQFENLLPLAAQWAAAKEKMAIENGIPLSFSQMEDAKAIGVVHPEKVKIFEVHQIPLPKHPLLKAANEATKLILPSTVAITFRYGIFIRSTFSSKRRVIVHELVHTSQYEKLGGFLPFLKQYVTECLTVGYSEAPMEQEAIRIARKICGC